MRPFGKGTTALLKSEDLANDQGGYREPVATIDRVESFTFDNGDEARTIYFVKRDKGLRLNVTNEKILVALFGAPPTDHCNTDEEMDRALTGWLHGQAIQLWVDPYVQYQGKSVPGLRLRAAPRPPSDAPPEPQMPPVPEAPHAPTATPMNEDEIPF